MKFLFGKREVITGEGENQIFTKYDFDMDCSVVYEGTLTEEVATEHITKLQERTQGLEFAMKLTGKVIKVLITLITGGWQLLLIKIGIAFKNLIKSLFGDIKGTAAKLVLGY